MVNPGGTGRPIRVISARLAPLPPSRSFRSLLPSMKSNTYLVMRLSPHSLAGSRHLGGNPAPDLANRAGRPGRPGRCGPPGPVGHRTGLSALPGAHEDHETRGI